MFFHFPPRHHNPYDPNSSREATETPKRKLPQVFESGSIHQVWVLTHHDGNETGWGLDPTSCAFRRLVLSTWATEKCAGWLFQAISNKHQCWDIPGKKPGIDVLVRYFKTVCFFLNDLLSIPFWDAKWPVFCGWEPPSQHLVIHKPVPWSFFSWMFLTFFFLIKWWTLRFSICYNNYRKLYITITGASQESPENGSCPSPKIRSPSRDRDDLGIRWPSVALLPTAMPPVQPRFVWRSNSDSWWLAGHTPGEWDEKNKSG